MMPITSCCTVVGATVHGLPFGEDESHPACVSLKLALSAKIAELCENGVTDYFVNAEYGVPLMAAEVLTALRETLVPSHRVHICVPYEEQSSRWNEPARDRYFRLHEVADSVTMLNTQYHDDCYAETLEFMLDTVMCYLRMARVKSCPTLQRVKASVLKHSSYQSFSERQLGITRLFIMYIKKKWQNSRNVNHNVCS
jgi:uncharacterized phage-like protein YoqJ